MNLWNWKRHFIFGILLTVLVTAIFRFGQNPALEGVQFPPGRSFCSSLRNRSF